MLSHSFFSSFTHTPCTLTYRCKNNMLKVLICRWVRYPKATMLAFQIHRDVKMMGYLNYFEF